VQVVSWALDPDVGVVVALAAERDLEAVLLVEPAALPQAAVGRE